MNYFKTSLVVIIACFILTSCKKKETVKSDFESFVLTADLNIPKDNMIALYYTDGLNQWFSPQKTIWAGLKKKDKNQLISLKMPCGVLPRDLRIDYCFEEFFGPIQINSIILIYKKGSFKIDRSVFLDYFKPNQYIIYNKETGVAKPTKINGKSQPFFSSKDKLVELILDLEMENI